MNIQRNITDLNYKVSTIKNSQRFETMVFDLINKCEDGFSLDVEEKNFKTEKEALIFHKKMIKKYSSTKEMIELKEKFEVAQKKCLEFDDVSDGGACNFDEVVIFLKKNKNFIAKFNRIDNVIEIDKINYGSFKGLLTVEFKLKGQAMRRTKMAEEASLCLLSLGLKSCVKYVLD